MKHHPIRFFLESDNIGKLILKCILLLLIPYAYLWFCGLVFDAWLKWYWMTNFTFFSLIFLWILALVLIVAAVIRFVRGPRKAAEVMPKTEEAAETAGAEEAPEAEETAGTEEAPEAEEAAEETAGTEEAPKTED